MVSFMNTYGKVSMTSGYFAELVSAAVKSGYGVAGMSTRGAGDNIKSLVQKDFPEKGVRVTEEDGGLDIELHIIVTYGLNIAAAVKSITHKVKYVVEDSTGLTVRRIRVKVDDVIA